MKLAFFGTGQMGQAAIGLARERGHEVGAVFTSRDAGAGAERLAAALRGHDVAIDFSRADAVLGNVTACVRAGVPLVEGTTGWLADERQARRLVEDGAGAMVHGANFSIGVNLFFRLVDRAGELFATYDTFIEEVHHAKKRDAPSGTALKLREILARHVAREVPIASTRAGDVPGVHRVGFDSAGDQVVLVHSARTREGFAAGALAAARWIAGRRGCYSFVEVLEEILDAERKERR